MQAFFPVMPNMLQAPRGDLNIDGNAPIEGTQTSYADDCSYSGEETPFPVLFGILNNQMPSDPNVNGQDMPGKWESGGILFLNTLEEMAPRSPEPTNPHIAKAASFLEAAFRVALEERFTNEGPIGSPPKNLPNQVAPDVDGDLSRVDFLSASKLNGRGTEETLRGLPIEEMTDDSSPKMEKCTLDFKNISQKFIVFDNDSTHTKPLESGSQKNEDGQSFLNGQSRMTTDVLESKQEADPPPKVLQTRVLAQIVEKAVLNFRDGQTEIKIHLKPEFLGHLRMQISTENQQVVLKMLTDIPMAKEIIESNIHHLKTALQSHGLEMKEINVYVSHDSDHSGDGLWSHEFQTAETASERHAEADGSLSEDNAEAIRLDGERKGLTVIDFFI